MHKLKKKYKKFILAVMDVIIALTSLFKLWLTDCKEKIAGR